MCINLIINWQKLISFLGFLIKETSASRRCPTSLLPGEKTIKLNDNVDDNVDTNVDENVDDNVECWIYDNVDENVDDHWVEWQLCW